MAVTVYTPAIALNADDSNPITTFRVFVRLSGNSNGQLRVRYRSSSAGAMTIVGAAFGKWNGTAISASSSDMTTTPFRLTFAGSNNVTIGANSTATSDFITHAPLALNSGDWIIVTFYCAASDGNQRFSTGAGNTTATTMFKNVAIDYSQAQTAAAMGNSVLIVGNIQPGTAGGSNYSIDLVETNDPGLPVPIGGISTAVAPVGPFKVAAGNYSVLVFESGGAGTSARNFDASTNQALAQTLTNVASSTTIASVTVKLAKGGSPTDNIFCEIRSTDASGTLLATSNNIDVSTLTTTLTSATFTFTSPPTISASAVFATVFKRSGAANATNYPIIGVTLANVYAGGGTQAYNGTAWSAVSSGADQWVQINSSSTIASDAYYFFGRDGTTATTLQAYKSTAPATSWSSIATKTGFATGVQFISAYQKNHIIHMCVTDGATTSINHKYQTFDASTDTFVTAETINSALNTVTSASANAYETSIVVRSTYEVVLYHHAARISTFAQTAYRRRTGVATWAAAVAVSATGTNCTNPFVMLGASDRLHFLHFNATNTIQRHLTSANVLGTAASTGATALPQDVNTRDDSGTIRHVGFTAASAFRWSSADNPTVTNAAVTLGTPVRTIDDNAIVWALYQNSGDSDLYVKSSSDSGATFGTAVSALVGTVTSTDASLSKNQYVYARGSNYVFPYIVNNSGSLYYNEYIVRSAGPTNYTLTADTGTLTAAGQVTDLDADRRLTAELGTLTAAGQPATLRVARKTAAGLGTLTLAGQDVTLTKTTTVTHRTMPADTGTVTLAGQTVVPRVAMPVTLGTLTLAGQPVTLRYTRVPLLAGLGTLTLSGRTVTLAYGRKPPASLGTITLAGQTATLKRNYVMPATLGTITLAGAAPNLIYSGAGSKSMPAGLGVVTLAGQTVTLRYVHKLIAGTGTITLAGQTVALRASHVPLVATLGTLTLSGQVVTARFAHRMVASLGTLTLAGQTATVSYAHKMPAGQGALTPSGQNVTLRYSRKMPAGLGTITLAGPVVNLIYSGAGNKLLPAGLGFPRLDGQPVTLSYARKMPAAFGTITLAGQTVALQRARNITVDVGSIVLEGKAVGLNYKEQARLFAETSVLSLTGCDVTMPITRRPPVIVQENLRFGRSVYVSRW